MDKFRKAPPIRKHVAKVYQMQTADAVTDEQIQQLEQGVELRNEKGIFSATEVTRLAENRLQMTIHQGVYHQVKRMLAAVGIKLNSYIVHRLVLWPCLNWLKENGCI